MFHKVGEQEEYVDLSCKIVAQVGVGNGILSDQILASSPSGLYLIDPWVKKENHIIASGVQDPFQDNNFRHVSARLGIVPGVEISRKYSGDAMLDFSDSSIDCVCLDSDHSAEVFKSDIYGWWPKIAPSGVMIGAHFSDMSIKMSLESFCTENSVSYDELEGDMWAVKKI